jgi:hypothetical protein
VKFYLGTHHPDWLGRFDIPLFLSRRRLLRYRSLPRARVPWALDSGAFTEVSAYGGWRTTTPEFVEQVRRLRDRIGLMEWAAPQDWMCEPAVLARTGLSLDRHLALTVENYCHLQTVAPEIPWVPVLQGWRIDEYLMCWRRYERAGIVLEREARVGLGSVCRRQATGEIERLVRTLAADGLRLHGFGMKTRGIWACADALTSADSMAWCMNGWRNGPLPECTHRNCSNCPRFAFRWYDRLMAGQRRPHQLLLV